MVTKKNATPRAARAGYSIYRREGGEVSLDDLNDALGLAGYGPVSDRMLQHYRNLTNAGFDHYISINRFDVARAASRYEDLGANPRYRFEGGQSEGVQLLIVKPGRFWSVPATVDSISETGALIRLVDSEYTAALKRAKIHATDLVTMRFLESGREVEGRIVEVDVETSPAMIEVQFGFLHSLAELTDAEPLPTELLQIRLISEDDDRGATTDQLGRRMYLLFELVDELRSLVNRELQQTSDERYAAPAVVHSLSVASPADIQLIADAVTTAIFSLGSLGGLVVFVCKFPGLRKSWYEGTGAKLDNEAKRQEVRSKEAELKEQEARAERLVLETQLCDDIIERLRDGIGLDDARAEEVAAVVRARVVPLLDSLVEAGVERVDGPGGDQGGAT